MMPVILTFNGLNEKTRNQQELIGQICVEGKGIHQEGFKCNSLGLVERQKVEVTTLV